MDSNNFTDLIKTQAKAQNLSHAYLVFGGFEEKTFVDLYEIKIPDIFIIDEVPIKIDRIRELIRWLYLRPHSSKIKLAIIRGIEEMPIPASNALLKVLEEPPEYAVLILQAQKKEKILPTILSRCQIVREKAIIDKDIPESYVTAEKIGTLSLKDRFDLAAKIVEDENLPKIINLWEEELRQKLLSGDDVRVALRQIFKTRSLLSTNTSVKLLLENLLLKM
jgi:DNA polymerase III delta prime subunit